MKMKKDYQKPSMDVIYLKTKGTLLVGSVRGAKVYDDDSYEGSDLEYGY